MVARNSLILILASIFIGARILAFFGLLLPMVQVEGGLIVISTGWALLRESDGDGDEQHPHKGVAIALRQPCLLSSNASREGGTRFHFRCDCGRRHRR